MPEGAILEGISLQDLEGGINLTAKAETYQAATQVQVNISDGSNNIFKTADIVSVECAPTTGDVEIKYPCSVTLEPCLMTTIRSCSSIKLQRRHLMNSKRLYFLCSVCWSY